MAATLADKGFRDDDWLFEIKWDGYRIEAVVKDGTARIYTRNGNDGETYFPKLLTKATWIEAKEAIVDGEVVAIGEDGLPDFSLLQELTTAASPTRLVYQAFDLLHLDGRSLLNVPLESRKQLLRSVLRPGDRRVRFADHVVAEGLAFLEAAKAQGLEGIIAKHRRSIYEPGRRSRTWLKIKIRPEQELVVGGWTPGEGAAKDLGALVVGYYEGDGQGRGSCTSRARSGRGSTRQTRKILRERLAELAIGRLAVRPAAAEGLQGPLGRRAEVRRLGQARDRDPRRARRLDPRRHRPPGGVQGLRRGRQAADRGRSRAARRDDRRPSRRSRRRCPTPTQPIRATLARCRRSPRAKPTAEAATPTKATREAQGGREEGDRSLATEATSSPGRPRPTSSPPSTR